MAHGDWDRGRDATNVHYGAALLNYGRVGLDTHNRLASTNLLDSNVGRNATPVPDNIDYRPKHLAVQSTQSILLSPVVYPWNTRDTIVIGKLKGTDILYNTRILVDGNLATCEGGLRVFQSDQSTHEPVLSVPTKALPATFLVGSSTDPSEPYVTHSIGGRAARQNWRIGDWLEISGATGTYSGINGLWQIRLESPLGTILTDEIAARGTKGSFGNMVLVDESGTECPVKVTGSFSEYADGDIMIEKKAEGCPLFEFARLTGTSGVPTATPSPITQSYDQGPYIGWFHEGKSVYEIAQLAYKQYVTQGSVTPDFYTQVVFGNCWQRPPKEEDDYYVGFSFNENPTLDAGFGSYISFSIEYITD